MPSKTQSPITTIQVKRYVVQQVKPLLEQKGWHLSWLTERLLNIWLSGSIDVLPEGGKINVHLPHSE